MGYTTEFSGHFEITPQLSDAAVEDLNKFCNEPHGGDTQLYPGFPSFWCDWEFDQSVNSYGNPCTLMQWNGSEKSYNMDEWAEYLRKEFFPMANIHGVVHASGETMGDLWMIGVSDGQFVRRYGDVSYESEKAITSKRYVVVWYRREKPYEFFSANLRGRNDANRTKDFDLATVFVTKDGAYNVADTMHGACVTEVEVRFVGNR